MPPTRPRKTQKQYPSILRKYVRLPRTRGEKALQAEVILDAMFALVAHFEIEPTSATLWPDLALALMCRHVPAFQRFGASKRGRPSRQDGDRDSRQRLLSEVTRVKADKRLKHDTEALTDLIEKWDRHSGKGNPFPEIRKLKHLQKDLKKARTELRELHARRQALAQALAATQTIVETESALGSVFGLAPGWLLPKR
jgi:hypothetical protein